MPSVSGGSICEFLHSKLLLPEVNLTAGENSSTLASPALKRKADSLVSPTKTLSVPHNMRVSRAFGTRFNSLVREMFGQYTDSGAAVEPVFKKAANGHAINPSESSELVADEEEYEVITAHKRVFVPGSMQELIYMHASWGMDFE